MAKDKNRRAEHRQHMSPIEFRDAYLRALDLGRDATDMRPDANRVFFRFPPAKVENSPLAIADRELLLKVGLPGRFSMHGFYGFVQVADAADQLLERLIDVCHLEDEQPDWADHVVLAEFGPVRLEGETPSDEPSCYLCLNTATGSVWFIQVVEQRSQTFVNSSLRAYAECLCRLKEFSRSLRNVVEETLTKDGRFDEQQAKALPPKYRKALRAIDPACMERSALWPRVIDEELSYWLPDATRHMIGTPRKTK